MPITLNGDTGIQTPMYNGTITANAVTPSVNMKNRIINGAMVIDQRNAGASVTPADGVYTLDRWRSRLSQASKYSVQQSSTAPAGFSNSLLITVLSAVSSLGTFDYFFQEQKIEGYNIADLNWGTANAKTVTLSFWVNSSVTGTFGGALQNNGSGRSYPFNYTISSANTWTQASVTIAGDTSGTWEKTNLTGISLRLNLGSGSGLVGTANTWASADYEGATGNTNLLATNGATFYITGVQLEVGSTATSFDYRPYGTELALCQRYYQKSYEASIVPGTVVAADAKSLINAAWGYAGAINTIGNGTASFQVTMRAAPTATIFDKAGNSGKMSTQNSNGTYTDNVSANQTIASESNITVQKYAQSCAGIAYAYVVSAEL